MYGWYSVSISILVGEVLKKSNFRLQQFEPDVACEDLITYMYDPKKLNTVEPLPKVTLPSWPPLYNGHVVFSLFFPFLPLLLIHLNNFSNYKLSIRASSLQQPGLVLSEDGCCRQINRMCL